MGSVSDFISKDKGLFSNVVSGFIPPVVCIPLEHVKDENINIYVKSGDVVKEGQTIAEGKNLCVPSSIPGIVDSIVTCQYADGKQGKAAKIYLKGSFSYTGKILDEFDWSSYDYSVLSDILTHNGIVNTFDDCVPLGYQLANLDYTSERILVLRLFDSDPSNVIDSFLSQQFYDEILEGSAIIARAMRASAVVLAFEKTKKNKKLTLNENVFKDGIRIISVGIDTSTYPNGFKHDLACAIKKSYKEALLSKLGCRDLYIDPKTAIAAYNAVKKGCPDIDCYVQVSGDCLKAAAIFKIKVGTTLRSLVEQCGGFKKQPLKIIVNGCLSGFNVNSLDIPVTADVKSVSFLSKKESPRQYTEECISCGKCHQVCPLNLYPEDLYKSVLLFDNDGNIFATSLLCSQCGLCNAVCPSRIPLSQTISLIKGSQI